MLSNLFFSHGAMLRGVPAQTSPCRSEVLDLSLILGTVLLSSSDQIEWRRYAEFALSIDGGVDS